MPDTTRWKIAGIIATLAILLSVPLYVMRVTRWQPQKIGDPATTLATFVGSTTCAECHKLQYDRWQGSHHDLAMDAATESTVLGDFDNAVFQHQGTVSKFYRQGETFRVQTRGPEGKPGDFEIRYTFGVYPLQQYLIPFPGGRLQCLPIAWDVPQKRWYHLYPDRQIDPKDWLYWTNAAQNWNGMCAECHSTNLQKNYAAHTDTYETTWSDIDVGCEACHGPGSAHVDWAQLPAMGRPPVDNFSLGVKTSGLESRELVELCAPCHARRASLGDYTHAEEDLLDSLLPSLLTPELYYADGQILEEVYVYGSFTQSKMYHREVRCSDCHDVHSVKTARTGNALCLQCHRAAEYDNAAHHFHKQPGEAGKPISGRDGKVLFEVGSGAQCVACHMPGRIYMGIDYRPDHSFRRPRPDLSLSLGVPNACNRCHVDKSATWSDQQITKWYGPGRTTHYGSVLTAGLATGPVRTHDRDNARMARLVRMAQDRLYPVIVRATAISQLRAFPGPETSQALELLLADEEALIRRTALNVLPVADPKTLSRLVGPSLFDPVKAVRIEAANKLAGRASQSLAPNWQPAFQTALKEFEAAMLYSADFATSRHNLGNLYARLGRSADAEAQYQAALAIDDLFFPAKVNLAMLYNQQGKQEQTKKLLREVVEDHPQAYETAYSLGLLLVETGAYQEAVQYLRQTAAGMPQYARVRYNLGLLLQRLKRDAEAEMALKEAVELGRDHFDYLYALADFYVKRQKWKQAEPVAQRLTESYPDRPVGPTMLQFIKKQQQ